MDKKKPLLNSDCLCFKIQHERLRFVRGYNLSGPIGVLSLTLHFGVGGFPSWAAPHALGWGGDYGSLLHNSMFWGLLHILLPKVPGRPPTLFWWRWQRGKNQTNQIEKVDIRGRCRGGECRDRWGVASFIMRFVYEEVYKYISIWIHEYMSIWGRYRGGEC